MNYYFAVYSLAVYVVETFVKTHQQTQVMVIGKVKINFFYKKYIN